MTAPDDDGPTDATSGEELDDEVRAAEVAARLAWVRTELEVRGASGALLRSRRTFAWLTLGGQNHVVVASEQGAVPLLVTATGAWALAPVNEAARIADEELAGLPIGVAQIPWEDRRAEANEARRLAGGAVVSEDDLERHLVERRSLLIPVEHARMRRLASDLRDVMDATVESLTGGETEDAIAGRLAGDLMARGIRAPVLLVGGDERIERYRHPIPTGRRVERRVMLVAVGERRGLHVAATRLVDFEPPSLEMLRRAHATRRVLAAMRDATRADATLDVVLRAAREAYAAEGFADEWRLHHQGGTIGYAPRERIAVPGDRTLLRPGMAVAWNPSITGTKVEATLLVTDGEPELLTG